MPPAPNPVVNPRNQPIIQPVNINIGGLQHCNVPKFKRAGPIDIKAWLFQMETYFQYARTPPDQWVNGIIAQIHSQHFAEIKGYRHLAYPLFRTRIVALFREPNL